MNENSQNHSATQHSAAQETAARMRQAVRDMLASPNGRFIRHRPPKEWSVLKPRPKWVERNLEGDLNEALQLKSQVTTRVRGHVSSRGRRAQARRDSRR